MSKGTDNPRYARDQAMYDGTPNHGATQIKAKKNKETIVIIAKIIKTTATKLFYTDKDV